jgi:hypothetical protein
MVTECNYVFSIDELWGNGISFQRAGDCLCLHVQWLFISIATRIQNGRATDPRTIDSKLHSMLYVQNLRFKIVVKYRKNKSYSFQ